MWKWIFIKIEIPPPNGKSGVERIADGESWAQLPHSNLKDPVDGGERRGDCVGLSLTFCGGIFNKRAWIYDRILHVHTYIDITCGSIEK